MHASRTKRRPQLEITGDKHAGGDAHFADRDFEEFENQGHDDVEADESIAHGAGVCPHVDRNDARCSHRFSLGRIDQAFNVCFGSFHACPLYHRIGGEVANVDSQQQRIQPLVEIRVLVAAVGAAQRDDRSQIKPVGVVAGLRKTGT